MGIPELVGGMAIVLGVFVAFMVWAVFPLIPFAIAGAAYATVRYGVPAIVNAAVTAERAVVHTVRWALFPVAVWALRGTTPIYVTHGGGRREN